MTAKASPRPWRVADGMQETIVDERNNIVANAANNATAALIVDAVNERDRLRDILRAFCGVTESLLANYEYRYREDDNSMKWVEYQRKFISDTRAMIGESKPC